MKFRHLYMVMAAGLAFTILSPFAAAKTPEQIFVEVSPSVVVVDIFDARGKSMGLGSGVVIGAGQVITNCHVAQKGQSLKVRQSGRTFEAKMQYADPERDLCQLSVPGLKVPPVALGTAKKLRVGQRVYAIGAPKGLELTLSEGLVSSLRSYEGSQYIQTSAAISPGSSGGGLFDDQGRLVGITTFYVAEGQNLNFALPADCIGELPERAQAMSVAQEKGGLDWLKRSIALEQNKDWQGLLNFTKQWVKSKPESAMAWSCLGVAYCKLEQYDQAIKACREALRIQPEYADAWNILGGAYEGLKQYGQAIKAFQEALRIQPEYVDAWYNLGVAYYSLKQYDQVIKAYREALRIQPEYAKAWFNLGCVYDSLKQYQRAIEAYEEALRLQPEYADAWNNLGTVYDGLQKYDQAIKAYREVLRLQPRAAHAWNNLGFAYHNLKQDDQAIKAYLESLRLQPELAKTWYNLGIAYHSQGQRDKVREIYQILRKLDPEMAGQYFKDLMSR